MVTIEHFREVFMQTVLFKGGRYKGYLAVLLGLVAVMAFWAPHNNHPVSNALPVSPIILPDRAPIILKEIRAKRLFIAAVQAGSAPIEMEMPRNQYLPRSFNEDRIQVEAYGEVEAIFDLSQITGVRKGEQYIVTLGKAPHLRLLPYTRLTRVTRETGWFVSPDEDLDAKARVSAEAKIVRVVCQQGILLTAEAEVKAFVRELFALGGVRNVTVVSSPGQCL